MTDADRIAELIAQWSSAARPCCLNDRRPAWLALAHEALDAEVAAAYGWPG